MWNTIDLLPRLHSRDSSVGNPASWLLQLWTCGFMNPDLLKRVWPLLKTVEYPIVVISLLVRSRHLRYGGMRPYGVQHGEQQTEPSVLSMIAVGSTLQPRRYVPLAHNRGSVTRHHVVTHFQSHILGTDCLNLPRLFHGQWFQRRQWAWFAWRAIRGPRTSAFLITALDQCVSSTADRSSTHTLSQRSVRATI